MNIAVITGSAGLVGTESVHLFAEHGLKVLGIDNDMRGRLFGSEASTRRHRQHLESTVDNYVHYDIDIREQQRVDALFSKYGTDIKVVIHAAGQPSHDWAARAPTVDFSINANGTLHLLEATRRYCPRAAFIFTSTNKVYGEHPNQLPLVEQATRWEITPEHPFHHHGIDETMSVDQTVHSLMGVSKLAADALVQEYGKYFGLKTVCFRGGCLTGPGHAGTTMHGFLSYLVKCAVAQKPYTIFGYQGKQVRDNLHASDLVRMFWHYYQNPRPGEVYNVGGGRHSHCSVREAIALCEEMTGRKMDVMYSDQHRKGDHIWYISDIRKFRGHYPDWDYRFSLEQIFGEIHESCMANCR